MFFFVVRLLRLVHFLERAPFRFYDLFYDSLKKQYVKSKSLQRRCRQSATMWRIEYDTTRREAGSTINR